MTEQHLGILISIAFVGLSVFSILYFTRKMDAHDKLLALLLFMLTLLSATWFIDNVVAVKIELLDKDENKQVFQIMNTIVSMMIGYYFASKNKDSDNLS